MLRIGALSVGYGTAPVLRDFSLQADAGEIVAVIGPNGCGKSTLLRAVVGLLAPQAGEVLIDDIPVALFDKRDLARELAFLPQNFAGGGELLVEEMVMLGRTPFLSSYGLPQKRDEEIVRRALQQTDTEKFRERKVGELSGGERQRVLLARAIAQQPRVLLLDEPTSNLDLRYQFEILNLVHKLAREEKLLVVIVLHQINLASSLADKMVLLNPDGSTCASGAPEEVMTPAHLEAVYAVRLQVTKHPRSGRPQAHADWSFGD